MELFLSLAHLLASIENIDYNSHDPSSTLTVAAAVKSSHYWNKLLIIYLFIIEKLSRLQKVCYWNVYKSRIHYLINLQDDIIIVYFLWIVSLYNSQGSNEEIVFSVK